MATFLFFIPPHFGHINPTLGIGSELLKRGHKVIWVGFRNVENNIFPVGGEYYFPEEFFQESEQVNNILGRQDEAAKNTANRMIRWAFESTWLPFCHLTMKHFPAILERIKPDVIFHDEGLVGAAICAHKMGIPYGTSISSAPGLYFPPAKVLLPEDAEWLSETMTAIKSAYSADSNAEILNSSNVNIIYTAKKFVYGDIFPSNYYFIGPALDGRPEAAQHSLPDLDKAKKAIYVSTGSLLKDVKQSFYEKVITAFADTDIIVLVTADPELFKSWPSNFIPRSFWPQLEILSKVDLVVTPCGFNTLNETLFFGKPLLAIPMANDQFGNGMLVEQQGCGLRLRFRRLTVQQLKESVTRLLSEEQFTVTAKELSIALKESGGSKKGADLLETLIPEN